MPVIEVSTHSRLKAAGTQSGRRRGSGCRFNTQPPKGGWIFENGTKVVGGVSTHSRLKAAGHIIVAKHHRQVCFNTQPPKGGWE